MRLIVLLSAFAATATAAPLALPEESQVGGIDHPTMETRVASIETAADGAQG
jgi:hypothetical protein